MIRVIVEFYNGGPVGVASLAATLNEEAETLEEMVEPFLLKIGFIKRTSKGRIIGDPALKHMGLKLKRGSQPELL